jgi:hypothetical protein
MAMVKVLIGALCAGVVVFIWGAISHMATPIGTMGIRQIPGEEKVVAAMKDSIRDPGFYFFPGRDMSEAASASEEAAYTAKVRQGPTGVLVITPGGRDSMSPGQLLTELGSSIAAALLAAVVLTQVRSGYLGRVLVVTLMGTFAFLSINVSYWNWFGFPTDYTIGAALDEIIGWFLGALVLAAIVRPAKAAATPVTE